jgi:hypothetical protein
MLSQLRKQKNNCDMFSRRPPVEVEETAERRRSAITSIMPNARDAEIFGLGGASFRWRPRSGS